LQFIDAVLLENAAALLTLNRWKSVRRSLYCCSSRARLGPDGRWRYDAAKALRDRPRGLLSVDAGSSPLSPLGRRRPPEVFFR